METLTLIHIWHEKGHMCLKDVLIHVRCTALQRCDVRIVTDPVFYSPDFLSLRVLKTLLDLVGYGFPTF